MNLGGKYHLACIMKVKMKSLSCVQLFATSWTISYQAPLSMQFSRQEYWSGLPFPFPGDLPNVGIEHVSLCLLHCLADSLPLGHLGRKRHLGCFQILAIFKLL